MWKDTFAIMAISLAFRASPARGQSLDPAYLSQFPTVQRIKAEVKGTGQLDTAARQLGALWQFRVLIYNLAAAQHRDGNRVAPDEKRRAEDYAAAYRSLRQSIDRALPDPEQRKWYYLHQRYENDRLIRDQLFKQFLTPDLRGMIYKTLGEAPPASSGANPDSQSTTQAAGAARTALSVADHHRETAELLAKKGDKGSEAEYELAVAGYKQAIALDPSLEDAYVNLWTVDQNDLQQYAPAVQVATQLRKRWPDDPVNAALLAMSYDKMGQDTEALREFQVALQAKGQPTIVEYAHRKIGQIDIRQDRLQEGFASLQVALKMNPADATAKAETGVALYLLKQYPEAVAAYQEAIGLDPDKTDYLEDLGYAYVTMGRKEEALQVAAKLDAAEDRFGAGEVRAGVQRYLGTPGNPDPERTRGGFYDLLGERLQQNDQHLRAIGAYEKAVALDPTLGEAYVKLALCFDHTKQYEPEIAAWKKALALMPPQSEYYGFLGRAYQELKRYPEAVLAFRKAIDLKPEPDVLADTYLYLGSAYNSMESYQDAVPALRQAVRLKPREAESYYQLGVACANLKQYKEAAGAFQRTVDLRPSDATAYHFLGLMYVLTGEKEKALAVYETLKTIDKAEAESLRQAIP